MKVALTVLVLLGLAAPAAAQVDETLRFDQISGIERRTRNEGLTDNQIKALTAGKLTFTGRFIPAAQFNGVGSTAGLGLQLYADPGDKSLFLLIVRGAAKASWPRPGNGSLTATGYNVGADFQLTPDCATPDEPEKTCWLGQFIASSDFAAKSNGAKLGSPALTWENGVTRGSLRSTFIVTAAYTHFAPASSASTGDFTPSVGGQFDFKVNTPMTILVVYFFKNDLSGEDDYEVSAKVKIGSASSFRVGVAKNGRVFANLTFKLFNG